MKYINLSLVNTKAIKAFSQKLKKFMGKGCNKSHLLIYTQSFKGQILSVHRFRVKICQKVKGNRTDHSQHLLRRAEN